MTFANWYSANVNPIQRSAGRSAVAAAAYRLGARLEDERLQAVHDFRAKGGILAAFTVAPAQAPDWARDPERLWNAAEAAERVNGRPARELRLALPASVPLETRIAISETIAAELMERYGVAVSVGVHAPDKAGDQRNYHAHILFGTRVMTEHGLGAKTRVLDDRVTGPEEVTYIRHFCADTINDALASAGSDERVSPESYATLGIDQEPTVHLGPAASYKERHGQETDLGNHNRDVSADNESRSQIDQLVDELAALDAEIAAATAEQFEDDLLLQSDEAPDRFEIESQQDYADTLAPATRDAPIEDLPPYIHAPVSAPDFDSLHRYMLTKAAAELTVMAAERADQWSEAIAGRVERIGQWWQNMRESFVEWRDNLQQSVVSWWEDHQPAHQVATSPPTPPPPDSSPSLESMEPPL